MKKLSDYNKDKMDEFNFRKTSQHSSGIACDKCGHELTIPNPHILLCSYPAQIRVECPNCGYTGYVVAI